jgi:dTMP kinase
VALNRFATGGLKPDLTVLLDLEPGEGLRRRAGSGDANRLDREPETFHRRVRERFLELARREPDRFVVLDAAQPEDALQDRIRSAFEALAARAATGGPR